MIWEPSGEELENAFCEKMQISSLLLRLVNIIPFTTKATKLIQLLPPLGCEKKIPLPTLSSKNFWTFIKFRKLSRLESNMDNNHTQIHKVDRIDRLLYHYTRQKDVCSSFKEDFVYLFAFYSKIQISTVRHW